MVWKETVTKQTHKSRSAAGRLRSLAVILQLGVALALLPALTSPVAAEMAPAQQIEAGRVAFQKGNVNGAIGHFEAALQNLDATAQEQLAATLLRLAQARVFAGQHVRAQTELQQALEYAQQQGAQSLIAEIYGAIGNAHLAAGEPVAAYEALQNGLGIARADKYPDVRARLLNNLGNYHLAQGEHKKGSRAYGEAVLLAAEAGLSELAATAAVNAATAAYRSGDEQRSILLLDQAVGRLRRLDASSAKAYGLINAGLVYADLNKSGQAQVADWHIKAYRCFSQAGSVAQEINDQRTASYAFGHLGGLYADEGQQQTALDLTRQAILLAQQVNAAESLYRWHWQSGRLLTQLGNPDQAIGAYRLAMRDLQLVREEMASCYADPTSSYQKTAGDLGMELVDLLLKKTTEPDSSAEAAAYLAEAQETLEAVKVFELRDYFKDDCVDAARFVRMRLDEVTDRAVIVYPILLPDRVEMLLSSDGQLKRFSPAVDTVRLIDEVRALRLALEKRTTWEFLPHAQQLYDWLLRPLEAELRGGKAETLVFVPDGALRTIPMAALHDGERFLIERYPVAITPGINLTDPRPVNRQQAKVLALGLTQAVQGFPGLPYVADEIRSISKLYENQALVDDGFRIPAVEKQLKDDRFNIVHIASHGQFGSRAEDTFLLAFDEKYTMDRFAESVGLFRYRDDPLDLLMLSACETAAGDDRAALGLAGVAVRAGASSALASLWHVNDPASFELVSEFYRQLQQPYRTRAAALQAAQVRLIGDQRYEHPGYWAPFLMINNWL